jgi:digeranylgeranylglycerophospholipid reductase
MRTYDLLVIGGGPGGAVAARTAAQAGLCTCLVEKRPAIGTPVRCAEGIGKEAVQEFISPDPRWISAGISRASVVAPDGTAMVLDSRISGDKVGYVLERKLFDRALINEAADAGADIFVKVNAKGPIIENGAIRGASLTGLSENVQADVVIIADGVESGFARTCGIDTTVPSREMMSCAQYLMTGIDIEPDMNVFHVGNDVAPGGYLWIFPKGGKMANVGVGIQGVRSSGDNRAIHYLDSFVHRRFPAGKKIEIATGGVPVCRPLPETAGDGFMIIGDAARVVEPLTGGGIYHAMVTGKIAAEVAMDGISIGDCSKKTLMAYDHRWRSSALGRKIERNYLIKEYFLTLTDGKLNRLIGSAHQIHLSEFSVLGLVRELVIRNPDLIADLGVLMDMFS